MAESAISVKPPKAVAGWFAAASDRQLGGATTIACFRPEAVIALKRSSSSVLRLSGHQEPCSQMGTERA